MNEESEPAIAEEEEEEEEKGLKQRLVEREKALERAMRLLESSQKYNEELRQQIEKLSSELHAHRCAAQNRVEAECQVDEKDIAEAYGDKPFPDWAAPNDSSEVSGGGGDNVLSIADSLKAAAEEVVWEQAGFVYDSASGLYYDHNSGYYYDHTNSLYYDPSTTAYYYYDKDEQTYKFHSYPTGHHGQQTSQTYEHGTTETTTLQDRSISLQQHTEKKACSARDSKSHKHKHKEKPKIKKGKVHKSRRRRTKSRKDRHKTIRDKTRDKTDDRAVADESESGSVVVAEDPDKQSKEEGPSDVPEGVEEAMEVESDSLATGESEMETEPESGELTDSSSSLSSSSSSSMEDDDSLDLCVENDNLDLTGDPVRYDASTAGVQAEPEVSANYPPCIRIVIQASDASDVGTFFLVTYPGGTIGRDGDARNVISLPDTNVSKVHAEIKYDEDNSCYTVQDCGSQNGTFINDLRISESKEKSAAVPLSHEDVLRVAGTHMLLHIHPGTDTCNDCEPGQVLASLRAQQTVFNDHVVLTKNERKKQARRQLKDIKKKYGLANCAYVDNVPAIQHPDYADKAGLRRRYVGSEHSSHKQSHDVPASVHRPISSENKGHRMLAKMGWKEGSGLGKDNAGRAEPVTVELRANRSAGLGSTSATSVSLDNVQSANRMRRLVQTQERYRRLDNNPGSQSRSGVAVENSATSSGHPSVGGNGISSSSLGSGDSVGSRSKRGSKKKMEITWIQGQTQKAT
ncbi:hypothetical protein ACOMHN_022714 [Nucella lapillus]